jgi:septal ring factor EnvC (AmiA/AmiB activator)
VHRNNATDNLESSDSCGTAGEAASPAMTVQEPRHRRWLAAAAVGATACVAPAITASATGADLTKLHGKLGTTQSQLNNTKSREKVLAGSIATLNTQVASLSGQISIVQARQAAARERLTAEDDRVAAAKAAVTRERRHMVHLRHVLRRAQLALGAELRSQYEQPQQSFISLVVDSGGFQQLLDGLQYLSRAKRQEQSVIVFTRTARAKALAAAARLVKLEQTDAEAADVASTQNSALAGMGALLDSRQAALADERAAQSTALAASQEQGAKLESAISTIQKREAAARAAAQAVVHYAPAPTTSATSTSSVSRTDSPGSSSAGSSDTTGDSSATGNGGASLALTGGWAIPYAVVLCESGGQNLPPNGAGASGYYQIEAATWKGAGGSGPAAYLAPKSEQDAIASKLWNGGKGASNWTCARIVGIT